MRRKYLLLVLLSTLLYQAWGQITLAVHVPPIGIVQKNQLWNLSLMNAGTTTVNATIEFTLLSADIPVIKAVTRPILVAHGIKQIKETDIAPITYSYLSSSFAATQNSNNSFLPLGNYVACYVVSHYVGEAKVILAEDCIPIEVQPLQPPLLNTPSNGQHIEIPYPQFTWLPPAPLSSSDHLTYTLVVAQVFTGESAEQSIQNHLPVYSSSSLTSLFNVYPSSFKSLDTGKVYAWRISAFNNNQFIANSDVWTFRISKKQASLQEVDGPYIKLSKDAAPFTTIKGKLRFEYINDANDKAVLYVIKRLTDGTTATEQKLSLKSGQNFIELDVSEVQEMNNKEMYLLQVINSRNEVWTMKFIYKKPELKLNN